MPIRPENKSRYPKNWKEIRATILERAGNRCEGEINLMGTRCGLLHGGYVLRSNQSDWSCAEEAEEYIESFKQVFPDHRRVKVILTIAHMDHTPENNNPSNLKALCQKCHNTYDAPMRAAGRKERALKDQQVFNYA